jgi:RNA 3'-terminal phosphate cyclase (ATP)
MLAIDGSRGEGGGQVLRSALSLSIVTGQAFRMFNIRARREKPGLRWQHLTAVRAAQAVSAGAVEGAALGATEITFAPGGMEGGQYAFDVGTAGSTTLIAQTLIPALLHAARPVQVTIDGGTHNPMSPPFEFLARTYLPLLRRMGAQVEVQLIRRGFYPAGGGRIELNIEKSGSLAPIELCSRGPLLGNEAIAIVSRLPVSIAHRELATLGDILGWPPDVLHAREDEDATGPGNTIIVDLEFENLTEVFAGFGLKGLPAETVAEGVATTVAEFLAGDAAVDAHLADQLLLPMAIAGGGRFTTPRPTQHTLTNIGIIETFMPVTMRVEQDREDIFTISVD